MSLRWFALFVMAGFAGGLVLSSCGSTGSHCLPSNCAGCCTPDGVCQKGTLVKQCGKSGELCQNCGTAGTCEEQVCIVYGPGDGGNDTGGGDGSTGGGSGVGGGLSAGGGSAGGAAGGHAGGAAGGSAGGAAGGTAGGAAGGATAGGSAGGTAGGAAGGATAGGAAGGTAGGAAGGAPANGLFAQYFPGKEPYRTVPVTRIDPNVDYDWGTGSPVAGIATDNFSVRWEGLVQPQYTQTYTFYTTADDGVRLWVNGVNLIDDWNNGSSRENTSGTIQLTAGQLYALRLEYFENTSTALAHLSWSSASQAKQVIPTGRLFPAAAPMPGGLWGDYFDDFNAPPSVFYGNRIEGPINYDWTTNGPGGGFPYSTYYSVRWTGTVLPPVSGTYTFYTTSDDGVRLYVNGVTLVDNWTTHGSTENSGTIALTQGQRVNVRLDYFQGTGNAVIGLAWETTGVTKAAIPATALAP